MNKKAMVVIGVVAAILVVLRFGLQSPSDQELISQALKESIQATKEGKPGGVLEHLSRSLVLNDEANVNRRDIADFIRDIKPDITVHDPKPTVAGERAEIVSDVTLKIGVLGVGISQNLSNVRIEFGREVGTKWGVFPTKAWRITSVSAPDIDPEQFKNLAPAGGGFRGFRGL